MTRLKYNGPHYLFLDSGSGFYFNIGTCRDVPEADAERLLSLHEDHFALDEVPASSESSTEPPAEPVVILDGEETTVVVDTTATQTEQAAEAVQGSDATVAANN